MTRSTLREVRNPVLALPGVRRLQMLDPTTRRVIELALRDIQADARVRAEKCWQTHKAPMAVYWKAVGVYAGHLARVLAQPTSSILQHSDNAGVRAEAA